MVLSDFDPKVTVLFIHWGSHMGWSKFRVQNNSTFNTYNEKLHLSHSPEHKGNINIAAVD